MKIDKFEYKKNKDIVIDTIYELRTKIDQGSFTNYYVNNYDYVKNDIKILENELKKQNFDLTEFFQKYKEEIYKDYDFIQVNGFYDSLLYYFDNENGILSGNKLLGSDDIEYVYKYKYGYFNYDMGKKFILQSFETLKKYYKTTAKKFLLAFISTNISNKNAKDIVKKSSVILPNNDSFILIIHLRILYSLLNNKLTYSDFKYNFKEDIKGSRFESDDDIIQILIGDNYTGNTVSQDKYNEIKNKFNITYKEILFQQDVKNFNL